MSQGKSKIKNASEFKCFLNFSALTSLKVRLYKQTHKLVVFSVFSLPSTDLTITYNPELSRGSCHHRIIARGCCVTRVMQSAASLQASTHKGQTRVLLHYVYCMQGRLSGCRLVRNTIALIILFIYPTET